MILLIHKDKFTQSDFQSLVSRLPIQDRNKLVEVICVDKTKGIRKENKDYFFQKLKYPVRIFPAKKISTRTLIEELGKNEIIFIANFLDAELVEVIKQSENYKLLRLPTDAYQAIPIEDTDRFFFILEQRDKIESCRSTESHRIIDDKNFRLLNDYIRHFIIDLYTSLNSSENYTSVEVGDLELWWIIFDTFEIQRKITFNIIQLTPALDFEKIIKFVNRKPTIFIGYEALNEKQKDLLNDLLEKYSSNTNKFIFIFRKENARTNIPSIIKSPINVPDFNDILNDINISTLFHSLLLHRIGRSQSQIKINDYSDCLTKNIFQSFLKDCDSLLIMRSFLDKLIPFWLKSRLIDLSDPNMWYEQLPLLSELKAKTPTELGLKEGYKKYYDPYIEPKEFINVEDKVEPDIRFTQNKSKHEIEIKLKLKTDSITISDKIRGLNVILHLIKNYKYPITVQPEVLHEEIYSTFQTKIKDDANPDDSEKKDAKTKKPSGNRTAKKETMKGKTPVESALNRMRTDIAYFLKNLCPELSYLKYQNYLVLSKDVCYYDPKNGLKIEIVNEQ